MRVGLRHRLFTVVGGLTTLTVIVALAAPAAAAPKPPKPDTVIDTAPAASDVVTCITHAGTLSGILSRT